MAMTQGLLSAMVAHAAPADLRGTAFGFFNLVSGLAMLASGTCEHGTNGAPPATFLAGAAISVAAPCRCWALGPARYA